MKSYCLNFIALVVLANLILGCSPSATRVLREAETLESEASILQHLNEGEVNSSERQVQVLDKIVTDNQLKQVKMTIKIARKIYKFNVKCQKERRQVISVETNNNDVTQKSGLTNEQNNQKVAQQLCAMVGL